MFEVSYNTTKQRKVCERCLVEWPDSGFYFYRDPKGGRRNYCKNCPTRPSKSGNKLEQVFERYKVDVNGCWIWQGSKDQFGYGIFYYQQSSHRAHRIAYHLTKGAITDRKVIDHVCRNKSCINPEHLEMVTQLENIIRAEAQRHCLGCQCQKG